MAYAITQQGGKPGIVTYQVGPRDSFTVLAATWYVDTNGAGPPSYWFDYRDSAGGIIGIQCVGQVDSHLPTLVSLVPGNPPAATIDNSGIALFPTQPQDANNVLVCPIMEPVALSPGCTVNAYVAELSLTGSTPDPMAYLDTAADPRDLHLWVEDTLASQFDNAPPATPPGPYMIVPGPPITTVTA